MMHHPALLVALPLLTSTLIVLVRKHTFSKFATMAVAVFQFALTIQLLRTVLLSGVVSYHLGGWAPPIGIELRVDPLSGLLLLVLNLITVVGMPFLIFTVDHDIERQKHHLFYALVLLFISGLTGMVVAGDAFNVFVFLEISALATYVLISLGQDKRSLTAALRYLVMGTAGSTFFLLGLGLALMATGTLNMLDLADRISLLNNSKVIIAALAFVTVGIGLKLAVFPLHVWLPDAYTFAPNGVTVLMSATATKVSFYVFCRFLFTVFGYELVFEQINFQNILLPLSIAAIFSGSIAAIYQTDIKRLLAYSSVAQLGYMLLGISLLNLDGVTGSLVHVLNHALMKAALFMAAGGFIFATGSSSISGLSGLAKQMPVTAACFVIAGISLIGVPTTVGFVSKWYLVLGALQNQQYWLVAVILVGSLLAVLYIWKIVEVLYFGDTGKCAVQPKELPLRMLLPMCMMVAMCVGFGIFTTTSVGMAKIAGAVLLVGQP